MQRDFSGGAIALVVVLSWLSMLAAATDATAQDVCAPLTSRSTLHITSTKSIGADAKRGVPAFCEVEVTLTPVEGSRIRAVYRLPQNWNGKILGLGGGGMAGNLELDTAVQGLSRGYAIIQNDLGHPSSNPLDPSFAVKAPGQPNVEGVIDFGHRATHVATTAGKELVSQFYRRPAQRAYFQGCSTGGRQGLAEVQRYPDDYDGVIAGAPVYTPLTYSNAILRVQAFHKHPESNLLPAHVPLIEAAVRNACDAKDGLSDGILTDPRACTWNPAELACKGAPSASCLTPAQVNTVRQLYDGVKTKDGRYAAMPLMRGGESDWVRRSIGTPDQPRGLNADLGAPFFTYLVKADPSYDIMTFDPERDMAALDGGLAGTHVHQRNPDIGGFVERGGKLMLWHGFNDPGPSPLSTIEYFESVLKRVPAAADSVRLFLLPGVLHCRGGAGPDQFDALAAMENWVERGTPPASIVATKANSPLSRQLCPYPQLARYTGSGDPNDAANFRCMAP